ncbi:glycerol-3-phosphate acyltransferase [Bacteroidota bacterium]
MIILIITLFSYLIGSIPFAYILVKLNKKEDIRNLGTGNVGAMNSYEITGKKWLGTAVFILDALKGLIAVLTAKLLTDNDFLAISFASLLVILGHNYSVFLKFKGGRGLSTAVGAIMFISPLLILIWAIMWLVGYYLIKRDIHVGNITAIIATPIIFFIIPENIIIMTTLIHPPSILLLKMLALLLCAVIFLRHVEPMKELFNKKAG